MGEVRIHAYGVIAFDKETGKCTFGGCGIESSDPAIHSTLYTADGSFTTAGMDLFIQGMAMGLVCGRSMAFAKGFYSAEEFKIVMNSFLALFKNNQVGEPFTTKVFRPGQEDKNTEV